MKSEVLTNCKTLVVFYFIHYSKFAKDHFFYSALLVCICNKFENWLKGIKYNKLGIDFYENNDNGSVPWRVPVAERVCWTKINIFEIT
jgi:hypothetical protein